MKEKQEHVYTYLLPVSINFENSKSRTIEAPYMGAAEYEFGAPQNAWQEIREAGDSLVVGELHGFYYAYDKTRVGEAKASKILLAMSEDRCYNKGLNWEKNYEGIYDTWLSMHPRMVISRHESIRDWAIHYAKHEVLTTNVDLHIGDSLKCMTFLKKNGVYDLSICKVVGLPENDTEVTVLRGKTKMRVPIWNCIPA